LVIKPASDMKKYLFTLLFILVALLGTAHLVSAQDTTAPSYQLLTPLPLDGANSAPTNNITINTYIPAIIKLITGLAGGMAVILIIVGGIKYITSATGMGKTDGKDTIENALKGLILVIGAYTILYTVNPALVQLNLSIASIPTTISTSGDTSSSPSSSTATATPCANCVAVPANVPQKPPGSGCLLATYGTPYDGQCTVNATLAGELENLTSSFGASGWQVTEMYPPTVTHISDCHNTGTCVDVALSATPSSATIATFLNDVQASGFSAYVYEACGSRLTQLQSDPTLKGFNIQCETTTTGENAHLVQ
jgi:type IV secretory pathway VirB2 component (pilin)